MGSKKGRNRSQRQGMRPNDECNRKHFVRGNTYNNRRPDEEGGVPDEPGVESYFQIISNTIGISQETLMILVFSCILIILVPYLLSSVGKEEKHENMNQQTKTNKCPAKILGLVGVETTYESADLRAALRTTWFPANRHANFRERRMEFVFVIENTKGRRMKEIKKENLKYGDILILKQSEPMSALDKTLEFFKTASKKFDAEYYIKADEHIYLRPDRLAAILLRKKTEPLEYIGCRKIKTHMNGKYDFVFAHGSLYILSAKAVNKLIKATKQSLLRYKSSADVAVGYAMDKAMVKLEEQTDLCQSDCSPKFVAVSVILSCSTGACNPVNKLKELHTSTMCSKTPTLHYDQFYGE